MYTHTLPLTPAHTHTHTNIQMKMNVAAQACLHTQNKFNLSNDNEPVTSYATACPYNGLGIHWPRYVLRSNTSLQYSIYGYTLHEQIRTHVHAYTHESGEAG